MHNLGTYSGHIIFHVSKTFPISYYCKSIIPMIYYYVIVLYIDNNIIIIKFIFFLDIYFIFDSLLIVYRYKSVLLFYVGR